MTEPYALHDSLGYQLTLLSRIHERRFESALAPLGLTRVKWCVLLAIGQEGHQSPSDIAQFIGIDRTATSRALRALETDGLLERSGGAGNGDGRRRRVTLTAKGATRLAAATEAARDSARHLADKLSWYQRDTLKDIISTLMEGEQRDVSGL